MDGDAFLKYGREFVDYLRCFRLKTDIKSNQQIIWNQLKKGFILFSLEIPTSEDWVKTVLF